MRTSIINQLVLASISTFSSPLTVLAAATETPTPKPPSSIFLSPHRDLAFALNIPSPSTSPTTTNSEAGIFFSLAFTTVTTWAAIGLGSSTMSNNPLILIAYPSSSGTNVTLSPRRSHGHTEPTYDPAIQITRLPGTGLVANGSTFVFNGFCANCRLWEGGGALDVKSRSQDMAFAVGGGGEGELRSDDPEVSVRAHWGFGSFTMDLVRATGIGGVPVISEEGGHNDNVTADGVVMGLERSGYRDVRAVVHALVMIFAFVGVWPFGVLVLRVGGSVRWHGVTQVVAFVLVFVGAVLGFLISMSYNRSRKFNTAHQIIGIFVFIFAIAQLVLGYVHHRIYKKTQQPTRIAPIHIWLGRLVIPLGIANGFTGFPLALSPVYNFALLGVVLFALPGFLLILLAKKVFKKLMQKVKEPDEDTNGYDMEPWRNGQQPVMPQPPPSSHAVGEPITPTRLGAPPQGARQFV